MTRFSGVESQCSSSGYHHVSRSRHCQGYGRFFLERQYSPVPDRGFANSWGGSTFFIMERILHQVVEPP